MEKEEASGNASIEALNSESRKSGSIGVGNGDLDSPSDIHLIMDEYGVHRLVVDSQLTNRSWVLVYLTLSEAGPIGTVKVVDVELC